MQVSTHFFFKEKICIEVTTSHDHLRLCFEVECFFCFAPDANNRIVVSLRTEKEEDEIVADRQLFRLDDEWF